MTDDATLELLPGVLREVAEEAGLPAALRLAHAFGGTEIWIPEKLTAGHRLIEALGREAAEKVVQMFGSGHLLVPLGPLADGRAKRREIMRMIEDGRTAADIARRLRCHVRTVYRARARGGRGDARQLDLLRGE